MTPDDDNTQSYVALTNGTLVGHYKIIDKLGAGGMGEVYLAEDTALDRKVALKFLPHHLCQDEECRVRFKREAQTAAKLNHPNIVHIYEVSEFQGRPYFSMEIVEGRTLKDVITGKELSVERVLELGIQICEGLQAAHEKGVIHRDIKPTNILIDSRGHAKIVDFGLASVIGLEHLTKTGSTLGTIGYMSPEQVEGKDVDARSDIFSLGVVLYELIAGRNPFKRDHEAATMKAVLQDTPEPLTRYKADVPDDLQRSISKMLEKAPDLRYQSAAGVISDLKKLSISTTSKTVDAKKPDWWNRYVVPSAVIVLLVVFAVWYFGDRNQPKHTVKEDHKIMLAVLPFQNLGEPEDEYFADGITDEVISKLASVTGLGVISRTSCMTYKNTGKTLPEIAHELGVNYILEGTIRWEQDSYGGRVRITPQLIDVTNDSHVWSNSYEREMSGIFAIQSEIADEVADNLGIILVESGKAKEDDMGTKNTQAYLAFLHGMTLSRSNPVRTMNEKAIEAYEKAVSLDSNFARAWALLSQEYSYLYHGWEKSTAVLMKAEKTAHKALSLNPSLVDGFLAMGYYYYWGLGDYERALEQFHNAEMLEPWNSWVLQSTAFIWRRQGRFIEARERLEQALQYDPRDALLIAEIAATYNITKDYDKSADYAELSLAINPDMLWAYNYLITNAWCESGDLSLSRHYLEKMGLDENSLDLWFLQFIYERDYDKAVATLQRMKKVDADAGGAYYPYELILAELLKLGGHEQEALIMYDSARLILEDKVSQFPNDAQMYSTLGAALAGLGRKKEAVKTGLKAVEMCPVERDAFLGPQFRVELAYIYIAVGDYDAALKEFNYIFSIPYPFCINTLKLDPRLDPLRDYPQYKHLIKKYGNQSST